MALKAPKGQPKTNFPEQKNIEAGVYPARVVQIIDFGLQPQKPYKGQDKPPCQEIGLTYELVDEFMKDEEGNDIEDKPRWISETLPFYGLYADKAKSTQRYLVFDPKQEWDGDFANAITLPCNVTIINNPGSNGKVYDNVASIAAMRPRDAASCPPLVNKPKVFDLDNPDMEVFNSFPKWIQEKLSNNLNFEGSPLQKALAGKPAGKPKKEEKAAPIPDEDSNDGPPFDADDNCPY